MTYMISITKKIKPVFILALAAVFLGAIFVSTTEVFAQSQSINLGPVTTYSPKQVIESPSSGTPTAAQILASSCPLGSILVGFNLHNMGENFSSNGNLYCREGVSLSFGVVTRYPGKELAEEHDANPFLTSTCPDGLVLVGFNLDNMGTNYSHNGSLYCREVLLVNLGPVTEYANKQVIESPSSGTPTASQIAVSSCPLGSILVGFNLDNVGMNYSHAGSLYCRQITLVSPPTSPVFNHSLSATHVTLVQGASGVSTVTATLATGVTQSQPVTPSLTRILNANGSDVLSKTDGTGIQFVSLSPVTITPTASSILTIRADANVPTGTYVATVTSNTASNAAADARTATFNIVITAPQTSPVLTCSPSTQSVKVNETANFSGNNSAGVWSTIGGTPSQGTGSTFSTSFATTGAKTVSVTVVAETASCGVTVSEATTPTPTAFTVVCPDIDHSETVNREIRRRVEIGGGVAPYVISWSGTDGLSGDGTSALITYSSDGTKEAKVTVTDAENRRIEKICSSIEIVAPSSSGNGGGGGGSGRSARRPNVTLTQTVEPAPLAAASVYLSQIPSTGFEDYSTLEIFVGGIVFWSIIISGFLLVRNIFRKKSRRGQRI